MHSTYGRHSIRGVFIKILLNYFIPRSVMGLFLESGPILSVRLPGFSTPFSFSFCLLGSIQGKAQVLMLTGKALNVTPDYSPKAEELLSKAVKLEPTLVEAWNQLGEVYWKKGDVAAAHTCFSGALTHVSCPLSPQKTQMGRMGFYEFPRDMNMSTTVLEVGEQNLKRGRVWEQT